MRQVVLDTETTGLEPEHGHRIIEIGCVEMLDRRLTGRRLQYYLQPDRPIDAGAIEVHGITNEFLADKPRFGEVVDEFIEFIDGAELVIHNAPFDVGFIDAELRRLDQGRGPVADFCAVTDTLVMARKMHPGQRNSLDALCKRYEVDNSNRELHGALLDAEILAEVYLRMTGGQATLLLDESAGDGTTGMADAIRRLPADRPALRVVRAVAGELAELEVLLDRVDKASDGGCLWRAQSVPDRQ